jgi:hypothetical protein
VPVLRRDHQGQGRRVQALPRRSATRRVARVSGLARRATCLPAPDRFRAGARLARPPGGPEPGRLRKIRAARAATACWRRRVTTPATA